MCEREEGKIHWPPILESVWLPVASTAFSCAVLMELEPLIFNHGKCWVRPGRELTAAAGLPISSAVRSNVFSLASAIAGNVLYRKFPFLLTRTEGTGASFLLPCSSSLIVQHPPSPTIGVLYTAFSVCCYFNTPPV